MDPVPPHVGQGSSTAAHASGAGAEETRRNTATHLHKLPMTDPCRSRLGPSLNADNAACQFSHPPLHCKKNPFCPTCNGPKRFAPGDFIGTRSQSPPHLPGGIIPHFTSKVNTEAGVVISRNAVAGGCEVIPPTQCRNFTRGRGVLAACSGTSVPGLCTETLRTPFSVRGIHPLPLSSHGTAGGQGRKPSMTL